MNVLGIEIAEQRFGGRAHAKPLLQRFRAAHRHPGHLRREAVDVVRFFLKQGFRNEHWHVDVLHAGLLKAAVQLFLDIFPERIARRLNDHEALHGRVFHEFRLLDDVRIPLRKIHVPRSDLFHHFLVCHI